MATLLECSVRGVGVGPDGSVIFSPHSDRMDPEGMNELFCFHLNHDGNFDLGLREFCDEIGTTSTPSVIRSSELLRRRSADHDMYDSGFDDSIVSDTDLLQMSNLRLGDESPRESLTSSRRSDTFPLPKLCLLSHFDEPCENELKSADDVHAGCEWFEVAGTKVVDVVDCVLNERTSVRRQRSPEAVIERCSRHRLSLDSYSESRSEDRQPIRRCSDSFVQTDSAPVTLSTDPHSVLPPPAPDGQLQANQPPPVLDDSQEVDLSPPSVGDKPLSTVTVPDNTQSHDNRLLDLPPVADGVFDPAPVTDAVFNDRLQLILSTFAPPCLGRLIGRKMGLDRVDVIAELSDRSMLMIVRHICGYLSDADLCRLLPRCIPIQMSCPGRVCTCLENVETSGNLPGEYRPGYRQGWPI